MKLVKFKSFMCFEIVSLYLGLKSQSQLINNLSYVSITGKSRNESV